MMKNIYLSAAFIHKRNLVIMMSKEEKYYLEKLIAE